MPNYWYAGTDWQCSSGPIITRRFRHIDGDDPTAAAENDLWPVGTNSEIGGATSKDVLADGDHPAVAIGPKANRPNNVTGVVVSYDATLLFGEINVADKFVTKHYVSNVNDWTTAGAEAGYQGTVNIGDPVYIDDTAALAAGITLSFAPLNGDNPRAGNPLFGYIHYDQTEYRYPSTHIIPGFPDGADRWPLTTTEQAGEDITVCVMHVNDSGQARALITE